MFPDLQLEILDRFTAVEQFLRKSPKHGDLSQTAKGLVFVQIYAIYEYTAKNITRLAITEIASQKHNYANLRASLLAIFLDPQLRALRDCGEAKAWEKRLELFDRAVAEYPIATVFTMPHDGSYFKHTQAALILRTLGIKRKLTVRRQHPYRIDEVVDHRNSVAHGEETARDIGRRYSRKEIWDRIELMKRFCLRLISLSSEHCSNPSLHCR
jgi:hypothetical protein